MLIILESAPLILLISLSCSLLVCMSDSLVSTILSATLLLVFWHPLTEGGGICKQLQINLKLVVLIGNFVRPTCSVILGCAERLPLCVCVSASASASASVCFCIKVVFV